MTDESSKRKHSRAFGTIPTLCTALLALSILLTVSAHQPASLERSLPPQHMRRAVPARVVPAEKATTTTTAGAASRSTVLASTNQIPLKITNNCTETVYPGMSTQHGDAPGSHGFKLEKGKSETVFVSRDWQGRIWGRTNCTFDGGERNKACGTGDCGGAEDCKSLSGEPPVTLAEFTLQGNADKSFYDISLVDGFNIGMAIQLVANGVPQLAKLSPNTTNPVCVASVADFIENFMPYARGGSFISTNASHPLPLEKTTTRSAVGRWCPWDLQVSPPEKPGDGVYPYPDDKIQRPVFQPCYSACAKFGRPADCCTGNHATPESCSPSLYSTNAKKVCPDAYTYAYDDQDSTFTTQAGAGFEIVLCPSGRSSNILATSGAGSNKPVSGKGRKSSAGAAFGESSTPPWLLLTAAALLVTAAVFSSL